MAEFLTLDPRDESAAGMGNIAPRPPTLDGRVIGLLSNNKPHSEGLLRMVADIIGQRYTIRGIVEYNKGRTPVPGRLCRAWGPGPTMRRDGPRHCRVRLLRFVQCARRHGSRAPGSPFGGTNHEAFREPGPGYVPYAGRTGLRAGGDRPSDRYAVPP